VTVVTSSKAPPIPKNVPPVPTVPLNIPIIPTSTSNTTTTTTNTSKQTNAPQPKTQQKAPETKTQQKAPETKAPNVPQTKAPNIPSIPTNIQVPTNIQSNEVSHLDDITTMKDTNEGLLNQINKGGFKLKKVVTVEKTGIDYLKKKQSVKGGPTSNQTTSGGGANKTGNFMDELKKGMGNLKKVNK